MTIEGRAYTRLTWEFIENDSTAMVENWLAGVRNDYCPRSPFGVEDMFCGDDNIID